VASGSPFAPSPPLPTVRAVIPSTGTQSRDWEKVRDEPSGATAPREASAEQPASNGAAAAPTVAQMGVKVSVVIPTLDEAENLPHVFARLPSGLHEVIVVDGHSTDDTVTVARRLRPDALILTQSGRGKGNAVAAGFAACTGDIIVMLDADGSTDASEIPRFVAALCQGADFVKGSRFAQGGASSDITLARRWGNRALNTLVNTLYGTSYTDLCYGFNAFWVRCLPYMRVDCAGFEVETLINIRIAKAGLVIHEVPSREHDRINGISHLHVTRDGTRVLRTIALERFPSLKRSVLASHGRRQLVL
jgi:glycosyltransferase involved in cell wall biosynthesis